MNNKRILGIALVLALCLSAESLQAATVVEQKYLMDKSSTATGEWITLISKVARYHRIIWYARGTVSTCQVKLEQSSTALTGSESDLISNQTCTSTGIVSSATSGQPNYVRIKLGTFSGSGSVTIVYQGFMDNPDTAGGSTVDIDQTTPGTTNGVVVNSSALPSGAATSAKQPALGTAGSASTDVLTIQGTTLGTPVNVTLPGIVYNQVLPTVANLGTTDFQVNNHGALVVTDCGSGQTQGMLVATSTGTSSTVLTDVNAATGMGVTASTRFYAKSAQTSNTGSTASLITFQNGSGGSTLAYTINPAGSGSNPKFEPAIYTSLNTALYFAAASSSTTQYVSVQGCYGP